MHKNLFKDAVCYFKSYQPTLSPSVLKLFFCTVYRRVF